MKIDFTGRGVEIQEPVRRLAARKLGKLDRLLPASSRAHVILGVDRRGVAAEVRLRSRQLDVVGAQTEATAAAALAGAIERVVRQADRALSRRRPRKGAESPRRPAGRLGDTERVGAEATRPRIVRSRRGPLELMTVEEAALQMQGRKDGVLVFRDAATAGVVVLFRRADGHLGLVEAEG